MLRILFILLHALLCFFLVLFSPVSALVNEGPSPPTNCLTPSLLGTSVPAPAKRDGVFPFEIRDDGTATYDGTGLLPSESASLSLGERAPYHAKCVYPTGNFHIPITLPVPTGKFWLPAGVWSVNYMITRPTAFPAMAVGKSIQYIYLQSLTLLNF